jgi:hypothetical protein
MELLKAVATPRSVDTPRNVLSSIPTDSQLENLLYKIGTPTTPVVKLPMEPVQLGASPVAFTSGQADSTRGTTQSVYAEKDQRNTPLSGHSTRRLLLGVLKAAGTPEMCSRPGANGNSLLMDDELMELLKDIGTPALKGPEKGRQLLTTNAISSSCDRICFICHGNRFSHFD